MSSAADSRLSSPPLTDGGEVFAPNHSAFPSADNTSTSKTSRNVAHNAAAEDTAEWRGEEAGSSSSSSAAVGGSSDAAAPPEGTCSRRDEVTATSVSSIGEPPLHSNATLTPPLQVTGRPASPPNSIAHPRHADPTTSNDEGNPLDAGNEVGGDAPLQFVAKTATRGGGCDSPTAHHNEVPTTDGSDGGPSAAAMASSSSASPGKQLLSRAANALQRTQLRLEADLQGYQQACASFFASKNASSSVVAARGQSGSGGGGRGGSGGGMGFDDDGYSDGAYVGVTMISRGNGGYPPHHRRFGCASSDGEEDSTSDGGHSMHSNTLSGFSSACYSASQPTASRVRGRSSNGGDATRTGSTTTASASRRDTMGSVPSARGGNTNDGRRPHQRRNEAGGGGRRGSGGGARRDGGRSRAYSAGASSDAALSMADSEAMARYRERQLARIMAGSGCGDSVGTRSDYFDNGDGGDEEAEEYYNQEEDGDDDTFGDTYGRRRGIAALSRSGHHGHGGNSSDSGASFVCGGDSEVDEEDGHFAPDKSGNPPNVEEEGGGRRSSAGRRSGRREAHHSPEEEATEDGKARRRVAKTKGPSSAHHHAFGSASVSGPIVGYLRVPREEALLLQRLRVGVRANAIEASRREQHQKKGGSPSLAGSGAHSPPPSGGLPLSGQSLGSDDSASNANVGDVNASGDVLMNGSEGATRRSATGRRRVNSHHATNNSEYEGRSGTRASSSSAAAISPQSSAAEPHHPAATVTAAAASATRSSATAHVGLDNVQLVRVLKAKKTLPASLATAAKYATLCDQLGLRLITYDDVADILSRRCMAVLDPLTLAIDGSCVLYVEGRALVAAMGALADRLRERKRATAVMHAAAEERERKEREDQQQRQGGDASTAPSMSTVEPEAAKEAEDTTATKGKKRGFFSKLFSADKDSGKDGKKKHESASQQAKEKAAENPADGGHQQHETAATDKEKESGDPNNPSDSSSVFSTTGLTAIELQSLYSSVVRAMLFLIETRVVGLVHSSHYCPANSVPESSATTAADAAAGERSESQSEAAVGVGAAAFVAADGSAVISPQRNPQGDSPAAADGDGNKKAVSSSAAALRSPDRVSFIVCLDGAGDHGRLVPLLVHMRRTLFEAYPLRVCGVYLLSSHQRHVEAHLARCAAEGLMGAYGGGSAAAKAYMAALAHERDERRRKPQQTDSSEGISSTDCSGAYDLPPFTGIPNRVRFFISMQTLKVQLLTVKLMRRLHTVDDLGGIVPYAALDAALRRANMAGFLPPLPPK